MTRRLLSVALTAAACLLLIAVRSAAARPGALDPTFGDGGVVRSEFGPTFTQIAFTALDPQPDGSFLAALRQGSEGSARIRRYLADGSRDQAFGEKWTYESPEAVQADGKTLKIDCGNSLVRFEADGTPDPTFGDHPCGSHARSDEVPFGIERILPLASGDILVAGSKNHFVMGPEEPEYVFEQLAIARYDEHGKLDPSFGDDGVVLLSSDLGFGGRRLLGIGARPGGGAVVLITDVVKSWFGEVHDHPGTSLLGLTASGARDFAYGSSGVAHLGGLVIALQPLSDGSILLAGDAWDTPLGAGSVNRSDLFLARYGDDGLPDSGFGDSGIATADFGGVDLAGALLVEDDGSAVVGGAATDTNDSYCLRFRNSCREVPVLAKFTADGSPDPAFGDDGRLELDSLAYPLGGFSGGIGVKALAASADEDILVGGGSGPDAFLAAMSKSGVFEGAFGQDGLVRERESRPSDNAANSLGVDRYGRVLVAGATNAGLAGRRPEAAVFRYLPNGALDSSYGNGLGYVRVPAAAHIAVAPDGSAVAASESWPYTLTRLKASGEIDASFGEDGATRLQPNSERGGRLASIALLPGGETILAGNDSRHGRRRIVLFRLRRDGRPARGFGQNGVAVLGLGPRHRCTVMDMAVQRDGRIVLAGYVHGAKRGGRRETLAAVRLMPNGTPDRSFGGDGLVALRIGRYGYATAVAIGPRGKILVGGRSWSSDGSAELLLRLDANGRLDRGFARSGIVRTPVKPRSYSYPQTILVGPDRIIVTRDTRDRQVRAFGPNGRLDRSFPRVGALDPHHPLAAPPAAPQDDKLLVLERPNSIIEPSFTLRRILLR